MSRDAWKRYRGDGSWYYQVLEAGFKYNLTDFQSALGIVQLGKCGAMKEARRAIALRYTAAFGKIPVFEVPAALADRDTSWHLYILRLRVDQANLDRDRFIQAMRRRGVVCSVHFIPLHLQPYYERAYGYRIGDFPVAEAEYRRCLSLPIYPGLTNEEVHRVIYAAVDAANELADIPENTEHASAHD